ncbi:hypothetical protein BJV74DRAFT_881704 [Russula compacta]|nr:hypothetical protein BJV74DRAFT_881704 [Russula compacta]
MGPNFDKIARSPTPPETDDDGEEWPVHGIVDGTNTTWMREIEDDSGFVASWKEAMRTQRLRKAAESQSIDLTLLASTPMHDRLTFESAQAVEEKMAERSRRGPPGKTYQGWMAEVERRAAHHERRGEGRSVSRKRSRLHREESCAESSRSTVSSARWVPATPDVGGETSTISDGDMDAHNDI